MRSQFTARYSLTAALAAALASLAACGTPAPPPPPPPPPPPAEMALSASVIQAAGAYQAYMAGAAALRPTFQNGDDVAAALKSGESYDPHLLIRGEIAYAAVAALQDPAFVAELRGFSVDPGGRRRLIDALIADSNYATAFQTAPTAAGLAEAALHAESQDLQTAGAAMKQAAYDIQHQPWSTQLVQNRDARLAQAKALSSGTPEVTIDQVDRMRHAADGSQPLGLAAAPVATAPYPTAVVRGLDIAALALLGAAGEDQTNVLNALLDDPRDEACLSEAKLNLFQCLAVAKPHYEDVFCLGQHVMMDTAQCVSIAAGAAAPVVAPLAVSSTETPYAQPPKPKRKHRTH